MEHGDGCYCLIDLSFAESIFVNSALQFLQQDP